MGRTTITLESDVEAMLRRIVRERGVTFKEAVNDAIRRGVRSETAPRADVTFPTYSMGTPRVDLTHALQLAGDLEDEEIVRKMEQGR